MILGKSKQLTYWLESSLDLNDIALEQLEVELKELIDKTEFEHGVRRPTKSAQEEFEASMAHMNGTGGSRTPRGSLKMDMTSAEHCLCDRASLLSRPSMARRIRSDGDTPHRIATKDDEEEEDVYKALSFIRRPRISDEEIPSLVSYDKPLADVIEETHVKEEYAVIGLDSEDTEQTAEESQSDSSSLLVEIEVSTILAQMMSCPMQETAVPDAEQDYFYFM